MKTCPECKNALVEQRGDYLYEPPHGQLVLIPNASWSTCPVCGHECLPKAMEKIIKRATRGNQ